MSKKPTKQQIKDLILKKQQKNKPQEAESDSDNCKVNEESYEKGSEAEDLEDYKVDGYHPAAIGETLCNGRYVIVQKLGWGHFSTVMKNHNYQNKVWLVLDKRQNQHFALKIQKSKKSYSEAALDELELLRDMGSHQNDVQWCNFIEEFNQKVQSQEWFNKDKLTFQSKKKQRKESSNSSESDLNKEEQLEIQESLEKEQEKTEIKQEEIEPKQLDDVTKEISEYSQQKKEIVEPKVFKVEVNEEQCLFRVNKDENYCIRLIDNFPHFGIHGKHYCSVFQIMGPTLLDLIQHFDQYDRLIGIWLVKIITKQLLVGLVYMHDVCQMIHTDIKPENLMIQLKTSYLGEFIEDMKKIKRKPTSMKWLYIQSQKNSQKNKKKYLKKKNKKKQGKLNQEELVKTNPTQVLQPTDETQIESIQLDQVVDKVIEDPSTSQSEVKPLVPDQQFVPEQLVEEEKKEQPVVEKKSKQKQNTKAPKIDKNFVDDDGGEDSSGSNSSFEDVDDSEDKSESSKAPYVDEETLYTLKWKDHILIKLEKEIQIKIVDFGNACWTHKKFTDNIQTREYRAPEIILGIDYQANTDIWSVACVIFELLTNNYLFKPKKGKGFGKSDDHLALMIETLGKMNKNFAMSGSRSRDFFNKNGQLINIKDLRVMPIFEILMDEYNFAECDALMIEDFLLPMLEYDPKKRISAKEALKHPWLWT